MKIRFWFPLLWEHFLKQEVTGGFGSQESRPSNPASFKWAQTPVKRDERAGDLLMAGPWLWECYPVYFSAERRIWISTSPRHGRISDLRISLAISVYSASIHSSRSNTAILWFLFRIIRGVHKVLLFLLCVCAYVTSVYTYVRLPTLCAQAELEVDILFILQSLSTLYLRQSFMET